MYRLTQCNCPKCDGTLINLTPHEKNMDNFWCDNCNIDITITYDEEEEDKCLGCKWADGTECIGCNAEV